MKIDWSVIFLRLVLFVVLSLFLCFSIIIMLCIMNEAGFKIVQGVFVQ